ncbi:MAG: hypothetical protein CVU42_01485 [Chloroflexi bacterium HGW-Chloroflexi-4]|jgi:hypothetical protein|nr:MAG: hypothetical protein CVU42_01485 [Chloroflexi bacterium HGW-Chloroflexi-4]
MKISISKITLISLLLIIMLVALPTSVFAFNGEWNTGTVVTVDYKANPAPSWLQIFSDGVKIDAAATLCYPFPQALDNWKGNIYRLVDHTWVKLTTTTKWMPDTEGSYNACASAPAAGTYVLMGYYHNPFAPTQAPKINLSQGWNTGVSVDIDPERTPGPEWLQLFFTGVKADKDTKICHPFPAGPFGWTAEIRQLKNGLWVKLPTTAGYIGTSNDNVYTACATTTEAGTFALFGFWTR